MQINKYSEVQNLKVGDKLYFAYVDSDKANKCIAPRLVTVKSLSHEVSYGYSLLYMIDDYGYHTNYGSNNTSYQAFNGICSYFTELDECEKWYKKYLCKVITTNVQRYGSIRHELEGFMMKYLLV